MNSLLRRQTFPAPIGREFMYKALKSLRELTSRIVKPVKKCKFPALFPALRESEGRGVFRMKRRSSGAQCRDALARGTAGPGWRAAKGGLPSGLRPYMNTTHSGHFDETNSASFLKQNQWASRGLTGLRSPRCERSALSRTQSAPRAKPRRAIEVGNLPSPRHEQGARRRAGGTPAAPWAYCAKQ
jgi:hypothetical protein